MDDPKKVSGAVKIERVDGPIRKISIGTDLKNRITEMIGGGSDKTGLVVADIILDLDFLENFGKVKAVVLVSHNGNLVPWKMIVDTAVIEYDMTDIIQEKRKNGKDAKTSEVTGKRSDRGTRSGR